VIDPASITPVEPTPEFLAGAAELGVQFEPGDAERLGHYLALLLEANKTTNLTAIREPAEAWIKHILDALTLMPALAELEPGARVIDVGSGGGLPGLPLAIVMPHLSFTLLEATGKKADFLRLAVATLRLPNVTVIADRAERLGNDRGERAPDGSRIGAHRESYDAVVARAVGRLSVLAELTVPFAKPAGDGKPGGLVLLIKGQKADEELEEATQALHLLKVVHGATINTPTGRIIVIEKVSATPKMYPRKDGEPTRAPLGKRPAVAAGTKVQPTPHRTPRT